MSGIALDASKVNSYVLPKLDKTNSTMQEAYSASLSLKSSLPGSFSYRGMVSDISAQITEVRKEVTQVKKVVTSKVELAKRIESKSESKIASLVGSAGKIGSIIGSAAGAIKGGAAGSLLGPLGAAAGAVTGAIAGGVTGTLMGKTGAKVAAKTVSGVKKVGSWLWNGIKNVGAKVVKGVKSIAGKVVSGAKKIGNAVKTVAKKTWTAVKNTGAKIVNGVTKAAKSIWNGIKSVGSAIWNGCKKVVKKVTSFVEEKALPWIKNIASKVWDGIKTVGSKIWSGIKKVGATVANLTVSLVEGITSFVEAIGDVVLLAVGAVCTVFTFLSDVIQGIATGEWEWSATSAVWKKWIMPWVGYDWTSKVFDLAYENRLVGYAMFGPGGLFLKEIDNEAADWAKRKDGIGYKIGKGVGYYVGLAVATYFTAGAAAGAAGAATAAGQSAGVLATTFASTTTTQAAFVAVGSLGKNTQKNYNSTIDTKTKEYYIAEEMKRNPKLTLEEATEIVDTNLENNVYKHVDYVRKNAMNNISGGEIAGNIAKAAGTAAIEGGTIYLAGTAGSKIKDMTEAGKIAGVTTKFINKNTVSVGIKASKAYAAEGYNSIVNNTEFDWNSANIDAVSTIIAESAAIGSTNALDGAVRAGVKRSVTNNVVSESMNDASNILNAGLSQDAVNEATDQAFKEITKTLPYTVGKEIVKRASKNTASELSENALNSAFNNN